jgi:peptide deformylase
MAIRKVILKGNPKLVAKNKIAKDYFSPKVKQVIKDLKDTLKKSTLVGIAAPQIAENYQIFITYPKNTEFRNFGREDILRVYINPKITFRSSDKVAIYEGCGSVVEDNSFPFGPDLRPREIEVEAIDEKGRKFSLRADGILARVIQHEFDHLQGTEFLKYVKTDNIVSEAYYKTNIKNSKSQTSASEITKIQYKLQGE